MLFFWEEDGKQARILTYELKGETPSSRIGCKYPKTGRTRFLCYW